MTRTLRVALAAVLLVTLVAGGAGTAAADSSHQNGHVVDDSTNTNVNENQLVKVSDIANDLNVAVLGVAADDTNALSLDGGV